MNKKLIIALTSITLMLAGCGNHSSKKGSGKASASPKVSESTEPDNTSSPEQTTQPPAETESTTQEQPQEEQQPAAQSDQSDVSTDTNQNTGTDISGNYQIISYDNGSGNKETFDPGNDDSIIGSSSIVLKKDGSCEYNMPGVGENTSCTWSGNTLQAAGAETQFTVSGNELTFQQNGETYTFQKAK